MTIELKKFGSMLVSRQAGKEALAAFEPSLRGVAEDETVVIDFSDVITFSSGWGDEFLIPLLNRYGSQLILKNPGENPSVSATIEILEKANNVKFGVA